MRAVWRRRQQNPSKFRYVLNKVYGVKSQKRVISRHYSVFSLRTQASLLREGSRDYEILYLSVCSSHSLNSDLVSPDLYLLPKLKDHLRAPRCDAKHSDELVVLPKKCWILSWRNVTERWPKRACKRSDYVELRTEFQAQCTLSRYSKRYDTRSHTKATRIARIHSVFFLFQVYGEGVLQCLGEIPSVGPLRRE
jgi:hypothetical protein